MLLLLHTINKIQRRNTPQGLTTKRVMAAIINTYIASFLLLCIFQGGCSQPCTVSNIKINQAKTGAIVKGQTEFEVNISNDCICSQTRVLLTCAGFNSVEEVDPNVFRSVGGDQCSVNNGLPLFQGSPITFKYAQASPVDFSPASSIISCS